MFTLHILLKWRDSKRDRLSIQTRVRRSLYFAVVTIGMKRATTVGVGGGAEKASLQYFTAREGRPNGQPTWSRRSVETRCVQGALEATRQVLCANLPHCGQLGGCTTTTGFSQTAPAFRLLLELEAMLFEKALPLLAAIIATAGEIKQVMLM